MDLQQRVGAADSPWEGVVGLLRQELKPNQFDTWIRPTRYLSTEGGVIKVGVPNELFGEWVRSQYGSLIEGLLQRQRSSVTRVEFVPPRTAETNYTIPPTPAASAAVANLNPRYTFENFVVSTCNQFAYAASRAVSDQPGGTYNPLFLYGGVGLGKTHLMQGIGDRLIQGRPQIRLRYLTSEQFMNELITAIRFEETPKFRDRYRSVDVLLIDDIQFLAGKESTQEEFFHTFNALYDAGKQIVLTSDCPPRSIPHLEERLRSRFEWGLLADIQPPDLETKVAILNKMASARSWALPNDVALFIAGNIHSNIRELEGCLTTLFALSSIRHCAAHLGLAREVVRSLVPHESEPVTIESIVTVVARHYRLKVAELKSKGNSPRVAFPRQVAMYLAKKLAGESYPSIGQFFHGKHHTTAMHAVRKIEKLRAEDATVSSAIATIESELR